MDIDVTSRNLIGRRSKEHIQGQMIWNYPLSEIKGFFKGFFHLALDEPTQNIWSPVSYFPTPCNTGLSNAKQHGYPDRILLLAQISISHTYNLTTTIGTDNYCQAKNRSGISRSADECVIKAETWNSTPIR